MFLLMWRIVGGDKGGLLVRKGNLGERQKTAKDGARKEVKFTETNI